MLTVPLKFMCSTQCDTPVRPGCSSPDPTRYQHHTDTSGAVCSSLTSTVRPLSRWAVRTLSHYMSRVQLTEHHGRLEGHAEPAPHGVPDEGKPADQRAGDARTVGGDGSVR